MSALIKSMKNFSRFYLLTIYFGLKVKRGLIYALI